MKVRDLLIEEEEHEARSREVGVLWDEIKKVALKRDFLVKHESTKAGPGPGWVPQLILETRHSSSILDDEDENPRIYEMTVVIGSYTKNSFLIKVESKGLGLGRFFVNANPGNVVEKAFEVFDKRDAALAKGNTNVPTKGLNGAIMAAFNAAIDEGGMLESRILTHDELQAEFSFDYPEHIKGLSPAIRKLFKGTKAKLTFDRAGGYQTVLVMHVEFKNALTDEEHATLKHLLDSEHKTL